MQVLIIKEDHQSAVSIKDSLDNHIFKCTICTNGTQAMAYIKKFKPHVILLDQQLPEFFGLDVAKWALHLYNPYVALIAADLSLEELKKTGDNRYIDHLLLEPLDLNLLGPCLNAKIQKSKDYETPRFYNTTNLDKEALISIIGKALESISVDLKVKDKDFLASALSHYMKDNSDTMYKELASDYGMFNKYIAYWKMKRISYKINAKMENETMLKELSAEVLKQCELQ